MFALPGPLLQYVREAAVIGVVTLRDSHRGHWRGVGILLLIAACLVEALYILQAQIIIPRDGKGTFFVRSLLAIRTYHWTEWIPRLVGRQLLARSSSRFPHPAHIGALPPAKSARELCGTDVEDKSNARNCISTTYTIQVYARCHRP
jgi:hypothetical protein